jgi:phosphoribosyl 1,2-cyclic phosphodiesterase
MSIHLSVLGSGSAGNCTLVSISNQDSDQQDQRPFNMLIDLGLSLKQTRMRLEAHGVSIDQIDAVILTHLDQDHLRPVWRNTLKAHKIPVHIHQIHTNAAARILEAETIVSYHKEIELESTITIRPVQLAHDTTGTIGFVIEAHSRRLGFATDLGHVPNELLEHFVDLDAIALESNYDPDMQRAADRPAFVKQRVMSGHGHLSNTEALDAITRIAARSNLDHVVLIHLSRQCNCPEVVSRLWQQQAPDLHSRLTIADQHTPTELLQLGPPMAMAELF